MKPAKNKGMTATHRFVEENPGANITDISKGLGFSYSTTTYYLEQLKKSRFVERRDDGRMARFFPATQNGDFDVRSRVILANPRRRTVIKFLADPTNHDLTVNRMAKKVGIPYNSFMHVLRNLQEAKMVDLERKHGTWGIHCKPLLVHVAKTMIAEDEPADHFEANE